MPQMTSPVATETTTTPLVMNPLTSFKDHSHPSAKASCEAILPPPMTAVSTGKGDVSVEVQYLSCSSSASTIAVRSTLGATSSSAIHPQSLPTPLAVCEAVVEPIHAVHITRAVEHFVSFLPATTAHPSVQSTSAALQQMLTTLLEKGYTCLEHIVCAMALMHRLHPSSTAKDPSSLEEEFQFPSMPSTTFHFLPSTSRRACIGLLRLVAKAHNDSYFRTEDMLKALDLSTSGELVGMTARCEWRLFAALGGDVGVTPEMYSQMLSKLLTPL